MLKQAVRPINAELRPRAGHEQSVTLRLPARVLTSREAIRHLAFDAHHIRRTSAAGMRCQLNWRFEPSFDGGLALVGHDAAASKDQYGFHRRITSETRQLVES